MRQLRHPKPDELSLTAILAALSDPIRLAIVSALHHHPGEHPWSDFLVDVSPSTLSHHLKTLRLAGVVSHRKSGTRCYLSLRPDLDQSYPGLLPSILLHAPAPSPSTAISIRQPDAHDVGID